MRDTVPMMRPLAALLACAVAGLLVAMARPAWGQCPPGAIGSCLSAHPTPGCSDPTCCATVCSIEPTCCTAAWDSVCVDAANLLCQLCGSGSSGSCFTPHGTPACNDATCCAAVCAADPFCCQVTWDSTCVLGATTLCGGGSGTCGDPGAGSCTQPHPTPACSDAACCESVCAVDPSCCSQAWDSFCVSVAAVACASDCVPTCPPGSDDEFEFCGLSSNAPCVDGQPGTGIVPISPGQPMCGRIGPLDSGIDLDAFRIEVTDTDGDGLARLLVNLTSSGESFVAVLPAPCAPLADATVHATVSGCLSGSASLCIAPGTWYLVVARGAFPVPSAPGGDCGMLGFRYVLSAQVLDNCEDACGSGPPCLVPHDTPGCADAACCATVCALDPLCCNKSWDQLCVDRAFENCEGTAPENDSCDSAIAISGAASVPFSVLGAKPTELAPPPGCLTAGSGALGPDVWFSLSKVQGPVELTTCASGGFDTAIVIYRDGCDGTTVVCSDDDALCPGNSLASTVEFTASCDETYLVRVAGVGASAGAGTLTVRQPGSACGGCPADLSGDGIIDGTDLSALLAAWGSSTADISGDGTVDGLDLSVMLAAWGPCQP